MRHLVLLCLAITGCALDRNAPSLELFTSAPEVELQYGIQGGFHVFVDARVEGMVPGVVDVTSTVESPSGRLSYVRGQELLIADDGDLRLKPRMPIRLVLCPNSLPVVDDRAVIEVTMTSCGIPATATIGLVPRCPSDPELASICRSLCAGERQP